MTRNYKFYNPNGLYFVSFAVINWIDVFTRNEYKEIFLESLSFCITNKKMQVYAWCIMTNHVHLIFSVDEPLKPELVLGDLKRFTSRKLITAINQNQKESRREWMIEQFKLAGNKTSNTTNHQFWRHDNKPIELWSNHVIKQKVNYIHLNPVEEGYVLKAEDYLYSSARDYAGLNGILKYINIIDYVNNY